MNTSRRYAAAVKLLTLARAVQALFFASPMLGAVTIDILLTLFFGLNIITLVIDIVLVGWAMPWFVKACEIYVNSVQPQPLNDRRRFLGKEGLTGRSRPQQPRPAPPRQRLHQ